MRKLNFTHGYIKRAFCFVGVVGLSHCSVNNEVQGTSASSSQQKSESQDSHSANFALYSANVMPPMPMGMTGPIPQSYNAPTAGMPMPMAAPTAPGQPIPANPAPGAQPIAGTAPAAGIVPSGNVPPQPQETDCAHNPDDKSVCVSCESYIAYKIGSTPYYTAKVNKVGKCLAQILTKNVFGLEVSTPGGEVEPMAKTLTGKIVTPSMLTCYRDYAGNTVLMTDGIELKQSTGRFECPPPENIGTTTQGQLTEQRFQPAYAGTEIPILGR